MSFTAAALDARLAAIAASHAPPARYHVAVSGGIDSTVLLHAAVAAALPVAAVHVNHRLHPGADAWQQRVAAAAAELGCEFTALTVNVDPGHAGPEAAARSARYAALADYLPAGDWLLAGHHRDDQAETLLLNLLRGSGPRGIAAMAAWRPFARGAIVRPLLDVSRSELVEYASRASIGWAEDPSNDDTRFDRNFVRHDVLPLLESRWPGAGHSLATAAVLARESSEMLDELAAGDLAAVDFRAEADRARLSAASLAALAAARQRNLLRYALRRLGLPVPGRLRLDAIVNDLLTARADAAPLVRWAGGEARRYRGCLFLGPPLDAAVIAERRLERGVNSLGSGLGELVIAPGTGPGLDPQLLVGGLSIRGRRGGESLKPLGYAHSRPLKKLLQENGVLPWYRDRLPLLYSGDRLVAVADLWIDARHAVDGGLAIEWRDGPAVRF